MENTGKVQISYGEAVSILTVSQIFPTVAFSINYANNISPAGCMISFVLGTLFNFLIMLPFFILTKKLGYISLLDCSYKILGGFAAVLSVALFLILISIAARSVTVFEKFITSVVFPDASVFTIIILLTVAAAYGAFLGIEALGRFSNIVFFLSAAAILLILVCAVGQIDIKNFGSLNSSDILKILEASMYGVFSNTGLIAAALTVSIVRKKHLKGFAIFNTASLVLVEMIAFCVTGVLGQYAYTKTYPFYSTASVTEFSVLRRLDAVYMCVWILVAFIRTTYYLLLAKNILDAVLSKKSRKYSLWVSTGIMLILSVMMSLRPMLESIVKRVENSGATVLLLIFFLPLILLLIFFFKGGFRNDEA